MLQRLRHPTIAKIIFRLGRWFHCSPAPPHEAVNETKTWATRQNEDGRSYAEIYAPQELKLRAPKTIHSPVHWHFRERLKRTTQPAFVARIPNGGVHGAYGSIVTGDGVVLGDLSLEWFFRPEQHSLLFKLRLPEPVELKGSAVSLASASGWNYFHWLLDVLPRLALLEKAGVDLHSVDWFVVNAGNSRFQRDSLQWLGIPEAKRIITGPGKHIKAKQLIVPSLPGIPSQTPPWAVKFLHNRFPADANAVQKRRKLYISRARSKYRNFRNETEVRAFLVKRGFEEVFAEDLSFREQVNLFGSAEAIVAPHGAGLANLVFCQPGTTVVEIFSPNYVNGCFWVLANWSDLNYCYLLGTGECPPDFRDPHDVEDNITVDLRALTDTFALAGLE